MNNSTPEKTILVSFAQASKGVTPSRYYRLVVADGSSIGFEARVVDSLPETGETKYIYLVKKASETQGNIYDEYMWVLLPDNTYGWEKIGVTGEVSVTLYGGTGQNTDGAMTQKATTDALNKIQTTLDAVVKASDEHGKKIDELDKELVDVAGKYPGSYTDEEWDNLWK